MLTGLTTGGGGVRQMLTLGVWTPPFLAVIICEQPLTLSHPKRPVHISTTLDRAPGTDRISADQNYNVGKKNYEFSQVAYIIKMI